MPVRLASIALLLVVASATTAHADSIHIVAFGDSMSAGYLVPREDAYPAQLEAALRRKGYNVTVKNAGRNGDTAKQALKRFDMAIDPGTDLAIVEFGINDRRAGASLVQVRRRIVEIVRALRARGIQVLVVGTGGLDFSELAAANGAAYVVWKLPPHRYRARDGAHFNAEGYRILVGRMLPQVEALLGRQRHPRNRSQTAPAIDVRKTAPPSFPPAR